ncbi:cyclin-dependent kinase inhibitor 1B-like [Pelobates fuscus]|uniref:cyclin-dependent kinase inhibitor 1B-like n=1 Tax=Pelobates fuscus TaxID=191477 RepID=UPI002FE4DA7A
MATFNLAQPEDMGPALPRGALFGVGSTRGTCRSLFGPIDHDELRSELQRQLKEIQTSDCQRWNFDFEAGTPLKGAFCWEPLESKSMPIVYRESRLSPVSTAQVPRQTQQPTVNSRIPVPTEGKEEAPVEAALLTLGGTDCAKENAELAIRRCQGVKVPTKSSTHITSQLRKREVSTTITDYFPKRKRVTSVAKSDSLKGTHPFCTLEQTPRKKIR